MAKRYRYAFARQKEAEEGILALVLAGVSIFLFFVAVILACIFHGRGFAGPAMGGISFCAMLLAIYGFIQGMRGLSRQNRSHSFSTAGAVSNGVIMIGWLGLFLSGL